MNQMRPEARNRRLILAASDIISEGFHLIIKEKHPFFDFVSCECRILEVSIAQ
jgi:hypothetical protein